MESLYHSTIVLSTSTGHGIYMSLDICLITILDWYNEMKAIIKEPGSLYFEAINKPQVISNAAFIYNQVIPTKSLLNYII